MVVAPLPPAHAIHDACPCCGYRVAAAEPSCPLCGDLREPARKGTQHATSADRDPAGSAQGVRGSLPGPGAWAAVRSSPRAGEAVILGIPPPVFFLGLGAAVAPVFTWTPVLCYMGWFLASLVHEMGHTIAAWFLGCPAFPAIRLDGHAATAHQERILPLALAIWASLAGLAWACRQRRALLAACAAAALLYPAVAFTGAADLVHLAAGQAGELAFATICFWRTLAGGFTSSTAERACYAAVGWYLLGRNVVLDFGLVLSATSRADYAESGSFGLSNDLIRIAEDVMGCPLESVGMAMGALALTVLPVAWVIWRVRPHD